jgi:Tol biopolymer transport system component
MKKYYKSLLLISFLLISCTAKPKNVNNTDPGTIISETQTPSPTPSASPTPVPETPDKIAFMSNRSGFWDIYSMNSDGTNQIKLTNDDMKVAFAFAVSPDGKKIAYISDKSGNPDLWVMELATKQATQMTSTELTDEGSPSWSPDNSAIAFHSDDNTSDFFQVLQLNYPLTDAKAIPQVLIAKTGMNVLHPAFSPDGTKILYSLVDSNGLTILQVYDNLNKKEIQLSKKEEQAINGSWSPDGRKIIYWTSNNGIFQVNLDGTAKSVISTVKNIKGTPFFSPDGKKIAIARGSGLSEDYNIWSFDNDGHNLQQLTTLGGISLGWYKNSNAVTVPVTGSASPVPVVSASDSSYIDPTDPLINP